MTTENKITRAWLEANGMVLTHEQDEQLRGWLVENDAHMIATVGRDFFSVLIYRAGSHFSGAAESSESLGEAVRLAQHMFDLKIIELVKRRARVVGQA